MWEPQLEREACWEEVAGIVGSAPLWAALLCQTRLWVNSERGLCRVTPKPRGKAGAKSPQSLGTNWSFLAALSQIMLFVDGMLGVIEHNETVQWLYTLCGSMVSATESMPHRSPLNRGIAACSQTPLTWASLPAALLLLRSLS